MTPLEIETKAIITALNISRGGVPKLPVEAAQVTPLGLEGDRQRDKRYHGGPERALCLFSQELMEYLQGEGHPITPGSTGENITIRGLKWENIIPGCRLRLGDEVEVEVTSYTTPCKNISASFVDGYFNRIHQSKYPGQSRLYSRVLRTGILRTGDIVEVVETQSSGGTGRDRT